MLSYLLATLFEAPSKVHRTFPQYGVKLIFAIISGIGKPNAFDDAVKGVDSIIHTASPAQFRVDDNERDLLARQSMAPITSSISFKSTHRV
jgi:hypothetical protein